ncbi:MAG: alpha-L-fucosidase [Bacteroidales bacterium]
MENKTVLLTFFCITMNLLTGCSNGSTPEPYGPVPSSAQLEWQKMEYYMFIHFGPNTFTDREWGTGGEDPGVFNPTALDCRQWASTAREAGMKGIIVTAKHHDGFCLWPSQFSRHTVRESPWKEGTGDVLAELARACREYDLKFGEYLSPWDRNHPAYGTAQYNEVFAGALAEVLSSYGPVFEQWFDGACGDDMDAPYDWELFHRTVSRHQPDAVIFSDIGPGCRWVGNERGMAGETNWSRMDTVGYTPGKHAPALEILNSGNFNGKLWIPAEADVSLRPGWFYSPSTDNSLKTIDELMEIYLGSVGRNANLLLNVPPDRSGRIPAGDSLRLMEFKSRRMELFSRNIAEYARTEASSVRAGKFRRFGPGNITDKSYDTYWTPEKEKSAAAFTITLAREETFSRILLQEYIPSGQRVARFIVECINPSDGLWQTIAQGTTIGYKRILTFSPVTSSVIRVSILEAGAPPLINCVELY